ncbi:MAG TPA: NAD(P)/FAD-dependent oxidoreductase [Actinomycetota bacterium]
MTTSYDVAIVGGGHNGLVSAFYLARAGLRTVVLERRSIVGGACVTEEFAPGFRASPGAYVLSMLRDAIWRDFRLRERGLIVDEAGPSLNVYPDGSTFVLDADPATALDAIRARSVADARAFPGFEASLARIAKALLPMFDMTAPDPARRRATDLAGMAKLGLLAMQNRRALDEMAFLFATSASQYLDEHFEDEMVKSALGWESISNTLAGPSTAGTAYGLLHEAASGGTGGGVGWGFVRGGMGTVTALIADAAREEGAEIRTDAEVDRIDVRNGRAVGVVLSNGDEVRAMRVLSNADPKRTFLGLVGASDLPDEFLGRIGAYRCEGASMKMNLAVAELPRVRGYDDGDGVRPYHRGLVQLTKPLLDLDHDQALARSGVPADHAHMELCVPSVHDPSLAPEGQHVVTIGVRSQPYQLRDGTWDEHRDVVADRVIAQLGEVFPNLPGSVLHREVLTPLDLERRLALTGGHHLHGDMAPDQLLFLRPVRGWADYRTPIRGLYLCGAGTHPGGGVTGANGRNCAREVLRDAGGNRRRRH